jgi:hypothetical protein
MNKNPKARSIAMKLSSIARSRKVPYERILTEFLIERMLARITKKLSSKFIFKGGYVGRRVYGSPRYTIDLDALLRVDKIEALQKQIIEAIETDIKDDTWFKFEKTLDLQTQGEYAGVRFIFRTGIGEILKDLKLAQVVNLDIGVGDFIQPVKNEIQAILNSEPISWSVYSKELIVAEKLHSFLTKPVANSRSKDLYDLLFYLPDCKQNLLDQAIKGTFKARKDKIPNDIVSEFKLINKDLLKRGWRSAIIDLDFELTFEETFKKVVELLEDKLQN